MNKISYAAIRSAFAIVLGFILILWPEMALHYLVITIGILFILPGIFTIIGYFTREKNEETKDNTMFPLDAAGSILFGTWLLIMPDFFINILMYVLGALLLLGGLQQIVSLVKARQWARVPWGFYVIPSLIFLTGILIVTYPKSSITNAVVVFGVTSVIYGFVELINSYKFRKKKEEIDTVIDISSSDTP
ncbi:uncharacterized membrane protein HdeD (DUF308 family) [Parabacteroides sp. PFB2-10]|uniref:HdeD family acid-resistance protein n=1 Tax=Parabacteroides sp. PFB2-10 TaxID=1742405 RepID=UPI0024752D8B|nr:DUF308 domain-containing protein [Parabacteroides sp. PFB2-10]MDH6313509.1 uncharacterized membrane protein HdeD (DUF308 family) [Parabacteroides sp. PFB2-10]MDL2244366.1 DUF308 domain-containing protein [Parabacteroides sp. OttesenSCG-928-J18]